MTRKLKIQYQLRQRGTTRYNKSYYTVPKLTLAGIWLQEAGFPPDAKVQVNCTGNQIIIKRI